MIVTTKVSPGLPRPGELVITLISEGGDDTADVQADITELLDYLERGRMIEITLTIDGEKAFSRDGHLQHQQ